MLELVVLESGVLELVVLVLDEVDGSVVVGVAPCTGTATPSNAAVVSADALEQEHSGRPSQSALSTSGGAHQRRPAKLRQP